MSFKIRSLSWYQKLILNNLSLFLLVSKRTLFLKVLVTEPDTAEQVPLKYEN